MCRLIPTRPPGAGETGEMNGPGGVNAPETDLDVDIAASYVMDNMLDTEKAGVKPSVL
jgi:hypothetical protein